MPDFLLRDVPADVMRRLKARAEHSGRSVQAEIRETLRESVPMPRDDWDAWAASIRIRTVRVSGAPSVADVVADAHRDRDASIARSLAGIWPEDAGAETP